MLGTAIKKNILYIERIHFCLTKNVDTYIREYHVHEISRELWRPKILPIDLVPIVTM